MVTQRKTKEGKQEVELTLKILKNNIKKIEVMASHYLQQKNKPQFLASNLNIHSLHKPYPSEKETEDNVGEKTHRNVFNTCFCLSFHKPKKDRCETCIEFENAPPQEKTLLEEKYQTHIVIKIIACDIKASQKLLKTILKVL